MKLLQTTSHSLLFSSKDLAQNANVFNILPNKILNTNLHNAYSKTLRTSSSVETLKVNEKALVDNNNATFCSNKRDSETSIVEIILSCETTFKVSLVQKNRYIQHQTEKFELVYL